MLGVIRGSCLRGGVRFEIEAVRSLAHCHCVNCRKLTGATFASYVHVEVSKCGSTARSQAPYLTTMSIPAGLFDDDPVVRPTLHVFVGSMAPCWEITDSLPQHDKWAPGFGPCAETEAAGVSSVADHRSIPSA